MGVDDAVVVEGRFSRDSAGRWPFQLDETGEDPNDFRVVRTDDENNVVGDFIFALTDEGDVLVIVRRFDEAKFGTVNFVLV